MQSKTKQDRACVEKESEGERNVLQAKIASLETVVKDQSTQLAKLNEQVEKSYSQVQAIAVKAVEGSATKIVSIPQQQQRQGEKLQIPWKPHLLDISSNKWKFTVIMHLLLNREHGRAFID